MARVEPGREAAEILALEALGYLASDEDRLMRFIAITGAGLDEIRGRAGDPAFLAGVFDYLLGDEALLVDFANGRNMKPEAVARLRRHLPGMTEEG